MPRIESTQPVARGSLAIVFVALVVLLGVAGMRGVGDPPTAGAARTTPPPAAREAGWRASRSAPVGATAPEAAVDGSHEGVLRLEGQILEGDDQPVHGARVTLGDGRSVATEADGSFAFDGLAEGRYDVTAEHAGGFAEAVQLELDDHSEPVTLSLVRGPTLVVRVVDGRARPLAGAIVEIAWRTAVTMADGTARFRAVDLGDEYIDVRAADHAHVRQRVATGRDPAATVDCTVVLAPGSEISGTVVDEAGHLVPEAYVELAPASRDSVGEAIYADQTGTWRLPSIATGTYVLRASSKLHVPTDELELAHHGRRATSGVVIRVARGSEIAGLVVDTAGRPLEGARVVAGSNVETTDARGEFVVRGLMAGTYSVSAATARLAAASQDVELARGQRAQLRFELAASSLAGTVVDRTGQPVENALVFTRSESPSTIAVERSDARGRFDFGGLPPGRYVTTAQRPDSEIEGPSIEATTANRHLQLVVPDPARITGRVVLDGKPVRDYRVGLTADPGSDPRSTAVYDSTGHFTERDATLGTLALVITGPGLARRVIEHVSVIAGATLDLGDIVVTRASSP